MFQLVHADNLTFMAKDHEASTGRPLVHGGYIFPGYLSHPYCDTCCGFRA